MEDKKINVIVDATTKELIIREGATLELKEPRIVSLSGTITAPRLFNEKRSDDFKENTVHVEYSRNGNYIKATFDERNHYATVVKGDLKSNPDLNEFGINDPNKKWQLSVLRGFLRMRRAFFTVPDKNLKLIENLSKFKANVETHIAQANDNRGNQNEQFQTTIKTNLDLSFSLTMPIFVGQPQRTFKVEVCFDIRDRQTDIWLESPELAEAIQKDKEAIFTKELKAFEAYVCIEQ